MLRIVDRVAAPAERAVRREAAALRIEGVGGVEGEVGAALVPERDLAEDAELVPGLGVLRLEPGRLLVERLRGARRRPRSDATVARA